jgi:hypothetical protein
MIPQQHHWALRSALNTGIHQFVVAAARWMSPILLQRVVRDAVAAIKSRAW